MRRTGNKRLGKALAPGLVGYTVTGTIQLDTGDIFALVKDAEDRYYRAIGEVVTPIDVIEQKGMKVLYERD